MLKKTLVAVVATALAMGAAVSASAGESSDVINPNTLGAAVAMPYLTTSTDGAVRMTVGTVTNASDYHAISLHLVWISGTDWSEIDYDCPLTPLETTYFIYEQIPGSDNALVTFECSDIDLDYPNNARTNNVVTRALNGADGIMFAAVECQLGDRRCNKPLVEVVCVDAGCDPGDDVVRRTKVSNILSADMTVLDFGAGVAFSAPAIHIQGRHIKGALGDRRYEFNGNMGEYKQFPSLLTTNYIAPDDSISAELLLFTLDGKTGSGTAAAKVSGFAYDDDENPTSGSIAFDCITITAIDESPNGFGLNVTRPFGGHVVGHLELFPAAVARSDEHELLSASNDGVRRALVHGYLIQQVVPGGQFVGGEFGGVASASSAWARQLTQGTNALVDIADDEASLDARQNDSNDPRT